MRYLDIAMKNLRKKVPFMFTISFALTDLAFLVHKIDLFSNLRFVSSPKIFYGVFITLAILIGLWLWRKNLSTYKKIQNFFLIILPTAVIFCIGINFFETQLHQAFSILTGFYFIALGSIYIFQYHKDSNAQKENPSEKIEETKHLPIIAAIIFLATMIHIFFGIKDIGKAAYVDEKLWIYDRIEQYWDNVRETDWRNTRPSDKPGVTTAIISGPGLLFFDPTEFEEGAKNKNHITALFAALRIPQFLSVTLLSIMSFFLIKKVLNTHIASFTVLFILLSPILLGMSRIINPDASLWSFLFLSFLSFIIYFKDNSLKWIYLSGFLLGLALLTKYIANIFAVFFLIIIFLDPVFRNAKNHEVHARIKNHLTSYLILIFTALSTFYIFYPGVWVKHDRLLLATIHSEAFASTWIYFAALLGLIAIDTLALKSLIVTKIISFLQKYKKALIITVLGFFSISIIITLYNTYTNMSVFDFSQIIGSPKSAYKEVSHLALYESSYFPLLFGITPFVFIFSVFGLYKSLTQKQRLQHQVLVFYSVLFILMYYIASTINNVAPIVRYQIVLYPFIILIASIGLYEFVCKFSKKSTVLIWISVGIVFLGTIQLLPLKNHYFSYNSPFLPQQHIINPKDMGDGNYEIAHYLNALPNPEDILIWTDKRGICQFFVGKCNNMIQDPAIIDTAPDIDYYVVSQNRENYINRLTEQKVARNPDYEIRLDRLYKKDVPTIYTLNPNNRSAQYIHIIDAVDVNIISK